MVGLKTRLQLDIFQDSPPLPYHAEREYITPPGRLEDEWFTRRFPKTGRTITRAI